MKYYVDLKTLYFYTLKIKYILYFTSEKNNFFDYLGLFHLLTAFQFRTLNAYKFIISESKYQEWACIILVRRFCRNVSFFIFSSTILSG